MSAPQCKAVKSASIATSFVADDLAKPRCTRLRLSDDIITFYGTFCDPNRIRSTGLLLVDWLLGASDENAPTWPSKHRHFLHLFTAEISTVADETTDSDRCSVLTVFHAAAALVSPAQKRLFSSFVCKRRATDDRALPTCAFADDQGKSRQGNFLPVGDVTNKQGHYHCLLVTTLFA